METSSPLAAMHPPAAPSFGHPDMFRSHYANSESRGSGTLFRERLMPKANASEYFNAKSSPSMSLAADFNQNFRIDNEASPQFPTPRRALFTTNVIMGALEGRGYQTTPPLPASSSPGMDMDISPLPQKSTNYNVAQIEIQSPTPVPTPNEDSEMTLDSPAPIVRQCAFDGLKPPTADRRKPGSSRRPSLSRAKGYSTSALQNRLHPDGQIATFRFGGDRPGSSSSSISLSECFQDSPPQERRPQSANSPSAHAGASRSRVHFSSLSNATMRNGSPSNSHVKKSSNPFLSRPRKNYRRSLSMFENSGDVIKPKEDTTAHSTLQAVVDVDEHRDDPSKYEPSLPHHFPEEQNDNIPRIDRATFLEVLDGTYRQYYDTKIVIDCRFEYEYEGGHIDGAINYNDKELLATHLFQSPMPGRTLIIFHCEYSAHRAPLMARHIRAADRTYNAECYPRLTYPDVYILEGGYSGFYSEHRERCYPCAYVGMDAAEHVNTCEREMGRLRQPRKQLGRAQTFAFGQHERFIHDSPGRSDCDDSLMGDSPAERGHARRMASY